ncbi:hypothetical protein [Devosia sp.]|uniref:hypothetical protein n=1 Tax=Devosia sp. TaxID=1871048 RepID=UPI003A9397BF
MNNPHNLVAHRDIQNWVSSRKGRPALRRISDSSGNVRARLALNFGHGRAPTAMPSMDDGISPCSWSAWLAELDRQQLALRVSDTKPAEFEFVPRRELN